MVWTPDRQSEGWEAKPWYRGGEQQTGVRAERVEREEREEREDCGGAGRSRAC
jgi:hypothetical protein